MSFSACLVSRKKERVSDEKNEKEKDLVEDLKRILKQIQVPDTKHETKS